MKRVKEERRVFSIGLPERLIDELDKWAAEFMRQNPGIRLSRSGVIEKFCQAQLQKK